MRDAVVKRSTRYKSNVIKVFPLVISCLSTCALHVSLAMSYSTEDFLLAYKEFCALRGVPQTVMSDAGNQILKAGKIMTEGSIEWSKVEHVTGAQGTAWTSAPITGQHRNGKTESLIKLFKKHIPHLIGNGKLNYLEFLLYLKVRASILNDRPLSYRKHGHYQLFLCLMNLMNWMKNMSAG